MLQLTQNDFLTWAQSNNILLRRLVSIASFILSGLFSSVAASAQDLIVQADRWCPYNCEPETPTPGYVVELLQAIFEPNGVKIRYQIVPWDRVLRQARDGNADAAIGATKHEADAFGLLLGSEPIGDSSDCLYVAGSSKIKFSEASDLDALKRVGVASGYVYSEDIEAWLNRPGNKGKIIVQKGEGPAETNTRNLVLGRLDGVIEDDHVMRHAIFKLGIEHELILAGCLKKTQIFVAFSPKLKNAQRVIKEFDDGMGALRRSGQLGRILGKYGLTDWK